MNDAHDTARTTASDDTTGFIVDVPCTGPFLPTPLNIPFHKITINPLTGRPEVETTRPSR